MNPNNNEFIGLPALEMPQTNTQAAPEHISDQDQSLFVLSPEGLASMGIPQAESYYNPLSPPERFSGFVPMHPQIHGQRLCNQHTTPIEFLNKIVAALLEGGIPPISINVNSHYEIYVNITNSDSLNISITTDNENANSLLEANQYKPHNVDLVAEIDRYGKNFWACQEILHHLHESLNSTTNVT